MEKSTEQKVTEVKLELLKDIHRVNNHIISDVNDRSKKVFRMLQDNRQNSNDEPIFPLRIQLDEKSWETLVNYFCTCEAKDLVGAGTSVWVAQEQEKAKVKQEIFNKL